MKETPYETAIALAKISEHLRDGLLDVHYRMQASFLGLPLYKKTKKDSPLKMHLKNFSKSTLFFGAFYYLHQKITPKGTAVLGLYSMAGLMGCLASLPCLFPIVFYFCVNTWLGFSFCYDYYRRHIRKLTFWL